MKDLSTEVNGKHVEPRAFANLVLDLIESFGCTPTPKAYEVFFAYASKRPPKVRLHVDAASAPDHVLRQFDLDQIHEETFRSPDGVWAKQDKSSEAIQVTLNEVFNLISAHVGQSQERQQRLAGTSRDIDENMSPAELQKVAAQLATETAHAVKSDEALSSTLIKKREALTEVREDLDVARREAITDELTGLLNARGFEQALEREIAGAVANGRHLSLCQLDIDNFSRINEMHDHRVGDAVLRAIGRTLPSQLAEGQTPGRNGGQTFALILPGRGAGDAVAQIETLRKYIAGRSFFLRGTGVDVGKLTASFGITVFTEKCTASDMLASAADMVSRAKKKGGNRVECDTRPTL